MPSAVFSTLISSGRVKESSPLGPLVLTVWPLTVAVTLAGTATGFLPRRDIEMPFDRPDAAGPFPQNTLQMTSPPTFSSRALASDMTPLGVERMATPRPLATLGKSLTGE